MIYVTISLTFNVHITYLVGRPLTYELWRHGGSQVQIHCPLTPFYRNICYTCLTFYVHITYLVGRPLTYELRRHGGSQVQIHCPLTLYHRDGTQVLLQLKRYIKQVNKSNMDKCKAYIPLECEPISVGALVV